MYTKNSTLLLFSLFFVVVLLASFFILYTDVKISTKSRAASTISLEEYCSGGYYQIPGEKVCSRAPKCGEYKNMSYDEFRAKFINFSVWDECMGNTNETRASSGCGGYVPACCYEMERLRDPEMCIGYYERNWCHPTQCAAINNETGCGGGGCSCGHAWTADCSGAGGAAAPEPLEVRLGQVAPPTNTPASPTAAPTVGPASTLVPTGGPTLTPIYYPPNFPSPTPTIKPTSSIFQNPTPLSGAPPPTSKPFSFPNPTASNTNTVVPTLSSAINLPVLSLPKLPEVDVKENVRESVATISKVSAKPLGIVEQLFKTIVEYDKKLEEKIKKILGIRPI